ncbi:hypothetical protein [Alicyclobacillus acidiphilus]|uniref:hypothetical protein n=1 Tax=Alicyclobacillus acidiphilus TaxID=182455 RepID=UPI000835EEDF|nr:hypothetical protein [Alicyclobacillus acidiphilus]
MAEHPSPTEYNAQVDQAWDLPLRYIRRSVYADQVCASFVEEWSQHSGLREYVARTSLGQAQRDANFYRNLVLGYCIRLHFIPDDGTPERVSIYRSLIPSLYLARNADERAQEALSHMAESAHWNEAWSDPTAFWHRERMRWLARTAWAVRRNVPTELWTEFRRYGLKAR